MCHDHSSPAELLVKLSRYGTRRKRGDDLRAISATPALSALMQPLGERRCRALSDPTELGRTRIAESDPCVAQEQSR